ncbi:CRP-like cAMP-binding protein [Edaphobacter lichenicola]|uniref:CRP-like cAMP-binding protein n=2 Tax=Tunturiibacter TaxID=3154218 RepID=A0A852VND8_9BACT|nr:CRP-like cAMP-binding protein [Edaphobacter lichenicola]
MAREVTNRLLESLNRKTRQMVIARSSLVDLSVRQTLSDAGGPPKLAYFLLSGFASEVVQLADGEFVEIGLVGNEGLTGSYYLLGPSSSLHRCFIQTTGTAYEIPFSELENLFAASPDLRSGVLKYVQHQIAHLAQTAACNRVHDAAPRFARWLLTIQDRSRAAEFSLTQDFLAQMLGIGRPTLNIVARSFEKAGLVGHRRGTVQILNRTGLRAIACLCYETTRQVLVKLYA